MFGDVDHLQDLFESASRCCSVLRGWIGSLISQHSAHVTGLQSANPLSDLNKENTVSMSSPILLSSSDSDVEEIDPVGRRAPPTWLPAQASGSNSRSKDYAENSRKAPSPNGISPTYNHLLDKFHPNSSADIRHSNTSPYFSQNGNATRTTLPLSMQGLNSAVDKRAHSQFRDTTNKGFMRDHSVMGNDDYMYDRRHPFVKSSTFQIPSSSEPQHSPGIGEAESDERRVYQAALQDLNQPKVEASLPDGLLSVSLLRHQKIALAWMLQKEAGHGPCVGGILADDQGLGKTISMIALIQMQKSLQSKSKPENLDNNKIEALNLDDEDEDKVGCGLDKVNNIAESDCKSTREASTSAQPLNKRRPVAGTLVVCPASVLRQWARELDEKVAEEAKLSVLVYHGGSRTRDPEELAGYDVVLTTYAIITNEVPKSIVDDDEADEKNIEKFGISRELSINKKRQKAGLVNKKGKRAKKGPGRPPDDVGSGTLAKVKWSRVILDEAQTIKNHRTRVAGACCSLKAKTRWCLSGTPIQNTIDDLYSYFRFLKYDPYAVYKSFYSTIKVPISRNSLQGYKKLQAVLRAIMLRRTKETMIDEQPIINLPPKKIEMSKVEFSSEERDFYKKLEADSRSQFKAYAAAGTVNQNYANILLMLLRLRQACDHPLLVKGYDTDSVGKDSVAMASTLSREMLVELLNALEGPEATCPVCNDALDKPVVTLCGHVFCYQCVSEYMTGDDSMCPAAECKKYVGPDVVFSESTLISCLSKDLDGGLTNSQLIEQPVVVQNEYTSSKVRAVIEIIQSQCKSNSRKLELYNDAGCSGDFIVENENTDSGINVVKRTTVVSNSPIDGPIKAIIFSQWTRMLDLVENAMNEYCIQYRRLDGTMTLTSRDRAVKEFNTDPEVTVMLMSLKAGNLGLNMVSACHVILLDLWWNPTTEDQAIDRAHRIGQTRPVTVTRLTIRDTVEDRILALQDEKRKMVASAFGEDAVGGSGTRLTVEDLRYLFMV